MRIIFEFLGGPNDGQTFHGMLGDGSDAERYFLLTNRGALGQRFKVASDYAVETLLSEQLKDERRHHFQQHYYVVTERLQEDGEVLVRAEYVEPDSDKGGCVPGRRETSAVPAASLDELVARFLDQTARAMAISYGHCWPAEDAGGEDRFERNMVLHLAHVLLLERFAVFARAGHPDPLLPPITLVGIAPGQDWFLAGELTRLDTADHLAVTLRDIARLEHFWLSARLTVPHCEETIARIARFCEVGYGLVAGWHWAADQPEPGGLLQFWKTQQATCEFEEQVATRLHGLSAVWSEPIKVLSHPGRGAYFLLNAFFRIPKPVAASLRDAN